MSSPVDDHTTRFGPRLAAWGVIVAVLGLLVTGLGLLLDNQFLALLGGVGVAVSIAMILVGYRLWASSTSKSRSE